MIFFVYHTFYLSIARRSESFIKHKAQNPMSSTTLAIEPLSSRTAINTNGGSHRPDERRGEPLGYFTERLTLYVDADQKSIIAFLHPYTGMAVQEDSEGKFS